jgi:uncharacterized protein YgiM (DUF1202 family)
MEGRENRAAKNRASPAQQTRRITQTKISHIGADGEFGKRKPMKKLMILLLACVLATSLGVPSAIAAKDYGAAVVNGKTASRVHLRASATLKAASLGLYYTGTEVRCASDPSAEWVKVTVGSQTGYMMGKYLATGDSRYGVVSKQPSATVQTKIAGSWVNLRSGPSLQSTIQGRVKDGESVTVLGETADHWFYIQSGSQTGYVTGKYLQTGSAAAAAKGYEMLYYTPTASIRIQYPRFTGAGMDTLNGVILSRVLQMVTAAKGVTIDYQASVTLKNSKVASMVFWGYRNVDGSIHPFSELIALTIDLSTLKPLQFTDLYAVNAEFEKVFFKKAYFPVNPITSYSADTFSAMLQLQTADYESISPFSKQGLPTVSFFLKPSGIVLSMPAMHATGSDHLEAELKYSDIQQFYRLSRKYWED